MGVKEDVAKLKVTIAGWTSTEQGYRSLVAGVLFVVGYFGILGQLSKRLDGARELRDSLKDTATWVDEINQIEDALPAIEPLMYASRDPNDWSTYLESFIEPSGVAFQGSGSRTDKEIKDYVFLTREITVTGEFSQLVEFVDLLERGERYVRVENVQIRAQQRGGLSMLVVVMCFAGETTRLREQRSQGGDPSSQQGELEGTEDLNANGAETEGGLESSPAVGGA